MQTTTPTISTRLANLVFRTLRKSGAYLIHLSIRLQMGVFKHPQLLSCITPRPVARFLGDLGYLLSDFPLMTVWEISASGINVFVVGSEQCAREIGAMVFDSDFEIRTAERVSPLALNRKSMEWLANGTDLVVCEVSKIHPLHPRAPIRIRVPFWVNQVIRYPDQEESFTSGSRFGNLRRQINRCQREGYTWKFSRHRDDFDYFYERLYLPFIKSRHQDRALIAPYPFQWDFWIEQGNAGLVLVMHDENPVAGALCHIANDVCYNVEIGVLDANPDLIQKGINTFLFWSVAQWGKEKGARYYNMGGSHGWGTNGSFRWKAKWGSIVGTRHMPFRTLHFLTTTRSPSLLDKLNDAKLICQSKGKYHLTFIDAGQHPLGDHSFRELVKSAEDLGLSGLRVIAREFRDELRDS